MNTIFKFLVISLMLFTSSAQAADYYFVLFCHDSEPRKAAESHTYAVFTQVEGREITNKCVINWGPIQEYRLGDGKVPGQNRDYLETLKESRAEGKIVKMWGPYQISPETFQTAVRQRNYLDSGRVLYHVADRVTALDLSENVGRSNQPAVNCIHAVSDIGGNLVTGGRYGLRAGEEIIAFFKQKGILLGESEFYAWIPNDLGVTTYLPTSR